MKVLQPFWSALRFLTILPVPQRWCGDVDSFYKSIDWYPLVGLVLGVLVALADLGLGMLLPERVASVMILTLIILLTGALHMDGISDTADAFFSSRGRERMLEIMKDSCAGPMGVSAVVLLLLTKLMLLISLPPQLRFVTLVLMPVCGRCAIGLISMALPYARPEGGTAAFTKESSGQFRVLVARGAMWLCCLLLTGLRAGVAIAVAAEVVIFLYGRYCRRKIGGYTGDTLGAASEIVELVPAMIVIMLSQQGVL